MLLKLIRRYFPEKYSIGNLYIDGHFFSDTLEDKYRRLPEEQKIYGQTAIPTGTYRVIMSYSPKFGRLLPELLNVPYFENIRIHPLNWPTESEGCIGVGRNTVIGGITESRSYSDRLNEIISKALLTENVYIEII
jgi:hypothetical protein